MLTSSNQYIRPEYLSPLPNTVSSVIRQLFFATVKSISTSKDGFRRWKAKFELWSWFLTYWRPNVSSEAKFEASKRFEASWKPILSSKVDFQPLGSQIWALKTTFESKFEGSRRFSVPWKQILYQKGWKHRARAPPVSLDRNVID